MNEQKSGNSWLFGAIQDRNGSKSWVDHVFCSDKILGTVSGIILDSIHDHFTKNEFLLETNDFIVLLKDDGALEEIASIMNEKDADHFLYGEWGAISLNLSFGPGSRRRYRLIKVFKSVEKGDGKTMIPVPTIINLLLYALEFPTKTCDCGQCNGGRTIDIDEKIRDDICAETADRIDAIPGIKLTDDGITILDQPEYYTCPYRKAVCVHYCAMGCDFNEGKPAEAGCRAPGWIGFKSSCRRA